MVEATGIRPTIRSLEYNGMMGIGGNDWLALTQGPTLEPEIPICDPHHRFWDFRPTLQA